MEKVSFEIFESLPRQGPGNEKSTRRAFRMLSNLPESPEILDAGCGTGAQTFALARLSKGRITAVDNHPPFIKIIARKVRAENLEGRIKPVISHMGGMNFPPAGFDVIWSEGAAYSIGFENALSYWRKFLKAGGFIVASELVWFRKNPPEEAEKYFSEEYPGMKHYNDIFAAIDRTGYELTGHFRLPDRAWRQDFYCPARTKLREAKEKYGSDPGAMAAIKSFETEINMHRKYSAYYGYGFYIMKKRES